MKYFLLSLLMFYEVLSLMFDSALTFDRSCYDYYWRDFYGTIPHDAIPAGADANGDLVYIGQVFVPGASSLLPATIFPKKEVAVASLPGRVVNTSENIKILCSPFFGGGGFKWISSRDPELENYTDLNLIPGGNEGGQHLYVGRVVSDKNETVMGKIFREEFYKPKKRGIQYPVGSTQKTSFTYEILLYIQGVSEISALI